VDGYARLSSRFSIRYTSVISNSLRELGMLEIYQFRSLAITVLFDVTSQLHKVGTATERTFFPLSGILLVYRPRTEFTLVQFHLLYFVTCGFLQPFIDLDVSNVLAVPIRVVDGWNRGITPVSVIDTVQLFTAHVHF
jgi:hypothetical protein